MVANQAPGKILKRGTELALGPEPAHPIPLASLRALARARSSLPFGAYSGIEEMKRALMSLFLVALMPGLTRPLSVQLATFKEVCATVTDIAVPQHPVSSGSLASDEAVTVGVKVLHDGSVAAVELAGSPAFASLAVDAAKRWRFAPLPKPESYPFRFKVSFHFRSSGAKLEILHEGDTIVLIVPKGEVAPGPLAVGGGMLTWFARKRAFAPYPPAAREQRIEGAVVVAVGVDRGGRVTEATAESGPMLLRGASERAAREWKFRPVKVNGQSVGLRGRLTFNFALNV